MLFGVIYSIDCPRGVPIRQFFPPGVGNKNSPWNQTEGNEGLQYAYLKGAWIHGKHRKFCALLDRPQFTQFVEHCGLVAQDVQTMGAIGMQTPNGFCYGLAPAISFDALDETNAILNAFVTPYPKVSHPERLDQDDWERTRRAVLAVYGRRR